LEIPENLANLDLILRPLAALASARFKFSG